MSRMSLERVRDQMLVLEGALPTLPGVSDWRRTIDAELKAREEPVEYQARRQNTLTGEWGEWTKISHKDHDEIAADPNPNHILKYETRKLYTAPPASKTEITEEVLDRAEGAYDDIAGDKFADMSRYGYERPINGQNPYVCERDCLRAALEATLKPH